MNLINLQDKKILITGASRGIGLAIAKRLSHEGAVLCLCASSESSFINIKTYFNSDKTFYVHGNLMKKKIPASIVNEAAKLMGGIDILINNAGLAFAKPMLETELDDWDKIMKLNARAPFFISKESIQYLKKSECASIINISSVVGIKGYDNQSAYSASKHALMGFTKAMAKELHQYGIRVHAIAPGGVATEMVLGTRPDLDASVLIETEEIADMVWFLLTRRGNAVVDEINIRRDANIPFK
ncbi:MAG: SDR family oxidoreductase [Clostridiales bacterium]|nr:SDR family oxidoreductase [Clostridiales bacterium]